MTPKTPNGHKELQKYLTALGCDPGPADGVSGSKTSEVARTCRDFETDVLPFHLDLAKLPAILTAYREHYPIE